MTTHHTGLPPGFAVTYRHHLAGLTIQAAVTLALLGVAAVVRGVAG